MARRNRAANDSRRRARRRIGKRRLSRDAGERLVTALHRDLPAVVDLLEGTAVEELRIEQDETVFAVKRPLGVAAPPEVATADSDAEIPNADTSEPVISVAATEQPSPAAAPSDDAPPPAESWTMTAPCVGIFRAGSRADTAPRTEVGATVQAGEVLGYVEAMGVMNDVEASCAGLVGEIAVEDGQPVEYGQPLFVLGPEDEPEQDSPDE